VTRALRWLLDAFTLRSAGRQRASATPSGFCRATDSGNPRRARAVARELRAGPARGGGARGILGARRRRARREAEGRVMAAKSHGFLPFKWKEYNGTQTTNSQ